MSLLCKTAVLVLISSVLAACGGAGTKAPPTPNQGCTGPGCDPAVQTPKAKICAAQADCLVDGYGYDDPLPQCQPASTGGSRCASSTHGIDLRFEVDTRSYTGCCAGGFQTLNTRFVLRRAVDGSEVTCSTLEAVASSNDVPDAIEKSKRFNLLAYDVAPVTATPGTSVTQPYLSVAVGKDFLIWTELWSGPRDSETKLPTQRRWGYGCFETGAAVEEVLPGHHCDPASPATCRTIRVAMPAPQG